MQNPKSNQTKDDLKKEINKGQTDRTKDPRTSDSKTGSSSNRQDTGVGSKGNQNTNKGR